MAGLTDRERALARVALADVEKILPRGSAVRGEVSAILNKLDESLPREEWVRAEKEIPELTRKAR